jgi:hypothetical protein
MGFKCICPLGRNLIKLFVINTLLLVLLTACAVSTPSATVLPVTPAPTPTPFTDYTMGALEVPAGQFQFIEYTSSSTCSAECNCPVVEPPRSLYELTGEGWLWVDPDAMGGAQALTGMMDGGFSGFYGYGQWREGIYPITSLPYSAPPYDVLQVYSIRSDGSAVVSIQGQVMLLLPGETWSDSSLSIWESPPGCTKRYDSRLTNHGFLSREQIHACPDRYHCE